MTQIIAVTPDQTVPPCASESWPEMVPNHGITIIAGLRPDGGEALHVVTSSNSPPWTIIGMLKCVMDDLETYWRDIQYGFNEDDDHA